MFIYCFQFLPCVVYHIQKEKQKVQENLLKQSVEQVDSVKGAMGKSKPNDNKVFPDF